MPDPSLKTACAVAAALALVSVLASCLPAPPSATPARATLTWTGDADLDLELHPLPPRPDTSPRILRLDASPVRAAESVDGVAGESIRLGGALPSGEALAPGDYLVAARFWSVGPRNTRAVNAVLTLDGPAPGPARSFTARLDDDSADLWLACIVSLPSLALTPVDETRVAGL